MIFKRFKIHNRTLNCYYIDIDLISIIIINVKYLQLSGKIKSTKKWTKNRRHEWRKASDILVPIKMIPMLS